ncbi:MAG: hypothetical protein ACYC23_15215 [Limisphaerales bacterium]
MLIHHVTLQTGPTATHRLDLLPAPMVAACRELLPHGGQIPGFAAFRVEIHAPVFTMFRGAAPLLTAGWGQGPDETWAALVELQQQFAEVKATCPASRWLAVALLPGLALTARDDLDWLGDFERCLAAAMLLPPESDE